MGTESMLGPSTPGPTDELKSRLQTVVEQIFRELNADVVTLYLYDEERDQFYLPIGRGLLDQDTFQYALPRPDRIAGKIVKEKRAVIAADARSHPEMSGPFTFRERIASAAGFPILLGDKAVGVFFVDHRQPHHFTPTEVSTVERRLREVSGILAVGQLARISRSIAPPAMTPDKSLDFIIKSTRSLVNNPVALWVLAPNSDVLTIRASNGLPVGFVNSAAVQLEEDNFVTTVIRTGEYVAIPDLQGDSRFPFQEELKQAGWQSVLAGPVRALGRVVGILASFSFARTDFARWEYALLDGLAQQISVVLVEERRSQIVADLQALGLTLASGIEMSQTLEMIVDKAVEVFAADIVTVYVYDQEYDEFSEPIARGVTEAFYRHPRPSKTGIAAMTVRKGEPVFSDDAESDPRLSASFVKKQGVKSSACFPLRVGDEVVGVLFVNYRTPYRFQPNDREMLTLFANQAALALNNARLFQEERRSATMARIANTFSETTDFQKTLQAVVNGAQQLTGAASSSLYMLDPQSKFQRMARAPFQEMRGEPRSEEGLTSSILKMGRAILVADASRDRRVRRSMVQEGTRSILGVPVELKGKRVGVLYVKSTSRSHFRRRDIKLLQSLADYGAIAIERARLLEAIASVNQAIANMLNLDDLIKELLGEIVHQLHFGFAELQLVNWEHGTIETVDGINTPWSAESKHRLGSDDIQADIVRTGKTEIIAGPDPRFDTSIYQRYGHEKLVRIFMPLIADGIVLGTVEAGHDRSKKEDISPEERASLESLVAQYAPRIWQSTLRYALKTIVEKAVQMVQADSGSIHLLHNQKGYVYQECAGRIGPEFLEAFPPRQQGIGHQALQDGHPVHIDNPGDLKRTYPTIYSPHSLLGVQHPDKYPAGQGVRAIACFPLGAGGRREGVLYVHFWKKHKIGEDEVRLLQLFADQVSTAIQNALLYEKLRDRSQALASLSLIGQSLVSEELRLNELLTMIAQRAHEVLKADIVTIYQYDQDLDIFITPPTIAGGVRWPDLMQDMVKPGDAQRVIVDRRQSIYAPEAWKEVVLCKVERTESKAPFVEREEIASSAGILLTVQKRRDRLEPEIVGVMFVNYRTHQDFTENERRIIENFASYAAIAIHKTRQAVQQQIGQLQVIQSIAKEIGSTMDRPSPGLPQPDRVGIAPETGFTLDQVLNLILDKSMEYLQVGDGYGTLQLFEEKTQRLVTRAHKNLPPEALERCRSVPLDAGGGIVARVARERKPLVVPDTTREDGYIALVPGMRSELAVPLVHEDRLIGVLNLESPIPGVFDDADIQFLTLLAGQVVVAIQSAHYVQQRVQLGKVMQTITSTTNLGQVLRQVAESTLSVLGADDAVIFPYNPDTGQFVLEQFIYQGPYPEELNPGPPEEGGIAYTVLKEGLVVIRDVALAPAELQGKMGKKVLGAIGVKAFVGVALKVQERAIGVLYVDYQNPHHFSDAELDLIRAFAGQAAIAIENAGLYENLRRRARDLDTLYHVARKIGDSADLQERDLLQSIVQAARETLEATCCTLFMLNEQGVLELQTRACGIPHVDPGIRLFSMGEGLAGWVAQMATATVVGDVKRDGRYIPMPANGARDPRSMVLAPLWIEGKIVGVISADQDRANAFDDQSLRFLETIAVQAGIAIQQVRQHRRRIEAIRTHFNPYVVGQPIREPEKFYGRKQLIQTVLSSIHNNYYIIYGERRIGKTSLLNQLDHHLRTVQDPHYHFVSVLASLEGVVERDFFRFLVTRITRAAGLPWRKKRTTVYSSTSFADDFEKIVNTLQKQVPGKEIRIVLLLDEMDKLAGYTSALHESFRSLIMTPSGVYLKMVLAGVSVQQVQSLTSPWYNLFRWVELTSFDRTEAQQLLVEPVHGYYVYDPEAQQMILDCSDLKPQEVQRLGYEAVNQMLDRVSASVAGERPEVDPASAVILLKDVEKAVERALGDKEQEYRESWDNFRVAQRQAIVAAMEAGGAIDMSLVRRGGLFSRQDLNNITRMDEKRQLHLSYLFMRWLQKERP